MSENTGASIAEKVLLWDFPEAQNRKGTESGLGLWAILHNFPKGECQPQLPISRSKSQIIYWVWGKYDKVFLLQFFRRCMRSILVPTLVVHSRPQWPIPEKGMGMKNCIPNFWEWEWEAGIPGNGREREFPLIPDPSHSSYRCVSDLLWEGLNKKSVVKDHTFHLFFYWTLPLSTVSILTFFWILG